MHRVVLTAAIVGLSIFGVTCGNTQCSVCRPGTYPSNPSTQCSACLPCADAGADASACSVNGTHDAGGG
jgi:hypothetical protein